MMPLLLLIRFKALRFKVLKHYWYSTTGHIPVSIEKWCEYKIITAYRYRSLSGYIQTCKIPCNMNLFLHTTGDS